MKTITFNPTTADDQQLVELIDEITQKLQTGQSCDVDDYIARYPQYADRLRDWITVMTSMADLGHSLAVGLPSRGGPPRESGAARLAAPTPGLLGDFRILREIGRGGMGVVYEAEQISLGRRVALKVLPFAAMLDKQQLARFKNEARAAATLDHPNIVAIYSVGAERGVHYYAMQLIEGQSLAEVIDERGKAEGGRQKNDAPRHDSALHTPPSTLDKAHLSTLPDYNCREYYRAVARLGIQAAEALDHAHASGIMHRDIKPANLLVDDTGKLWITDFGLARMEQDAGMTMTGDLLGTLRYMSPEQALAKRAVVDHRSDIYSLGITLYELLTLQPAFAGDDRQELLQQIAFDEPRKLRLINGRIPHDLETIVLKTIEKNPADRYATADELADDLRRYLGNEAIKATAPNLLSRVVKWSRRHKSAVIAAISIAVVVLVFLTAFVADRLRQVRDGTNFVRESLSVARATLDAGNVSEALQRVAEAKTRLAANRLTDQELINEVAAFEHECQRYSAFQLIIQRTRTENREGSEEALERAREGLDLYNVVGDDQWLASLRSAGLPDSHINRVAAAVYELLLLNANLEMDSHSPPQTAMALLEQAAAFHAPSRGYYWILADCYSHLGEHQKVAQLQAKALQAPIDHAGELWYINRDRRGDDPTYPIERSLSEHREMLRFDPTYYNGLFFMSYLLANEDRYAEALVGWYGCIAQCPDDWTAVVNRGLTHEMLGHHSEALADLEAAAAAGTGARNYNWILSSLAFFLATTPADALRDGRRAIDLARQACEATDYKQSTSLDALAAAYAEIGDFQAAIQWAEKAVQLVPDDESRSEYEKHLQSFRAQRPWRKTPISTEQQSMTDREAIKNGR